MTFSVRGEPTVPINHYSTIPFSATAPQQLSTTLRIWRDGWSKSVYNPLGNP